MIYPLTEAKYQIILNLRSTLKKLNYNIDIKLETPPYGFGVGSPGKSIRDLKEYKYLEQFDKDIEKYHKKKK